MTGRLLGAAGHFLLWPYNHHINSSNSYNKLDIMCTIAFGVVHDIDPDREIMETRPTLNLYAFLTITK